MKSTNYIFYLFFIVFITAISCNKEEEIKQAGTIAIVFNHKVGDENLSLRDPGDQEYDYTDENDQQFNISNFGYYISDISFSSMEGLTYADPNKITADASKLTGFYHVLETDPSSQIINIEHVTARSYNKIKFTIGVKSYSVISGPPGGILDPANGAWFLNMEAGYVNLAIEGNASNSGQEYVNKGNEPDILEGTFSIQVSGWKEISSEPGQNPIFVDNTVTVELNFNEALIVKDGLLPEVHIGVDLLKILADNDFSQTYAVDNQNEGRLFSEKFTDAFTFDFISQ